MDFGLLSWDKMMLLFPPQVFDICTELYKKHFFRLVFYLNLTLVSLQISDILKNLQMLYCDRILARKVFLQLLVVPGICQNFLSKTICSYFGFPKLNGSGQHQPNADQQNVEKRKFFSCPHGKIKIVGQPSMKFSRHPQIAAQYP